MSNLIVKYTNYEVYSGDYGSILFSNVDYMCLVYNIVTAYPLIYCTLLWYPAL